MSETLLKHLAVGVATGVAFLAGAVPLQAGNKHDYPETGTVISAITDHGDVYKIDTGDKIYQMECGNASARQAIPRQCDIAGKPIAVKDTVHFRIEDEEDEDVAYMPARGNHEERLRIVSTELNVLPPLPATTNPSAGESCAVLGRGMDLVESQSTFDWPSSTAHTSEPPTASGTSTGTSTGPVMAIPATGGPPVLMTTIGSSSGSIVTGVPVTGGPPITAISLAPNSGASIGGTEPPIDNGIATPSSTTSITFNESEWVPFLRVQTAGYVYKLACQVKECWLKNRAPLLGNLLTIRIQDGVAHLAWQPPGPKGEQKFPILSLSKVDKPAAAPSH
jgi:hypothetical protein